jgi:hypothetical protein
MPYTDQRLPFSGRSPLARHHSYQAAVAAGQTRGRKRRQYLDWLAAVRQATDHGAAEALGWPLSTVCSVRNACVDHGQVEAWGSAQGRYGKRVTIWRRRELA